MIVSLLAFSPVAAKTKTGQLPATKGASATAQPEATTSTSTASTSAASTSSAPAPVVVVEEVSSDEDEEVNQDGDQELDQVTKELEARVGLSKNQRIAVYAALATAVGLGGAATFYVAKYGKAAAWETFKGHAVIANTKFVALIKAVGEKIKAGAVKTKKAIAARPKTSLAIAGAALTAAAVAVDLTREHSLVKNAYKQLLELWANKFGKEKAASSEDNASTSAAPQTEEAKQA